jgi:hypothetical protein
MRGRRHRYGREDPDLPKATPLNGQVLGAKLLGARYREEGVIAHGAMSERWRLTDNINDLLGDDSSFVAGNSMDEILESLKFQHPSPVAGVSYFEVCDDNDLKRYAMPFGDTAIKSRRLNLHHAQYHWQDKYTTTWLDDPIETLTQLCMGGDDLLISIEAEQHLREDDDFWASDLVIGRKNTWYSIVKYRPTKAAARRKTKDTIATKDQHANDLLVAGRDLRDAAALTYTALRDDLEEFGVNPIITQTSRPSTRSYRADDHGDCSVAVVGYMQPLLVIHAALLGKNAYRYNLEWHKFLDAVQSRPKDLNDDTWGNYVGLREWLAAECKRKRLKPPPAVLAAVAAAKAAAEAEELKSRTCTVCGKVVDHSFELYSFRDARQLCDSCYEVKHDTPETEVEPAEVVS